MATQKRRSATGLIDQARAQPYRFEFFQLVRLLRLHYSRAGRIDPETRPHDDPLRFRSQLTLAFPASEVSELKFERAERTNVNDQPLSEVQITFMGLVGPSGVLPRPYTELLIDRHIQHRDDAAHAFMDLFSHRMIAQFYQAWQKYKFHIEHERKGSSDFERYLLSMVGFGEQARRRKFADNESGLRPELFSYFSGLLSQRPRNHQNLQVILSFYFGLPFILRPFAGRWLKLATEQCTRLGRQNAQLGQSSVIGNRVWDYQSCMRVEIGPLVLADYRRFLPGTKDYRKLVELVRFYLGPSLDFELAPILKPDAVPVARLGREDGVALGWLGWFKRPGSSVRPARCGIFRIPFDGASL